MLPLGQAVPVPEGRQRACRTLQGTSKADGNLLINVISRLVINICKSLLYHCLKYTFFNVFLGRVGIVLGLCLKVLASETKVLAIAL